MLSEIMSLDETSANAENSNHKMARIFVSATTRTIAADRMLSLVPSRTRVRRTALD
jgi:ribosomal protein L20A (L18A)